MSTEFDEKCVEKAFSMKEIVQNSFNYLHDINLLFDFASSSSNPTKNKKNTPVLRKKGFELLSNLGLLKNQQENIPHATWIAS